MPTASETAAIRHFVREADAEIARREHAIDRLHCELAELRRRSELHKAIIAPIRRVPPEIMAEIFLQLAAIEARVRSKHWLDYYKYNDRRLFEHEYTSRPFPNRAPLIFGGNLPRMESHRIIDTEFMELHLPRMYERKHAKQRFSLQYVAEEIRCTTIVDSILSLRL
jgi:hypothetical protein